MQAKDGWLGNEQGPGSLARFIHEESPNAYGSVFECVKQNDKIVQELQDTGRVLVVYFEDLSHSLPAQIDRIAEFLKVVMRHSPLSTLHPPPSALCPLPLHSLSS